MDRGLIFDIQRFSVHDGPGIRTTVFFKGCPLRCLWCHNPESVSESPELLIQESRCIGCGSCAEVCPTGAASPNQVQEEGSPRCELCGRCVEVCPAGARRMVGRTIHVEELLTEIRKDRLFYDESGGGATFSGGEPLSQPRFLLRCLEACRDDGIHTAVDTSGFAPRETIEEAARVTDLFLFDLKVMDDGRHRRLTGVSNEGILANLEFLARRHPNVWLRLPVIPGFNDDEANLEAVARLGASLASVRRISLLPYHHWASGKYAGLGRERPADGLEPPSRARLEALAGSFRAAGLETSIGG